MREGIFRAVYLGGLISFAIFIFYGVAIRYIQPTLDVDIYFHLAYGKEIVKTHSLRIDENQYRWTDYAKEGVGLYPAWIPEVIFYLLYKLGGGSLYFLYSFRIFVLFLFLMILIVFCYKWRIQPSFFLFALFFMMYLLMRNGMMFKADMFSVIFYFLLVSCYFWVKWTGKRKFVYFMPLIILLWANSHIGVVMGIVFLAYAFGLELIFNFRDKKRLYIDFGLALLLSGAATFLTPKPLYYYKFAESKFAQIAVNSFVKNAPVSESFKYIMAFRPLVPDWHSAYFGSWAILLGTILLLLGVFVILRYFRYKRDLRKVIKIIPWIIILLPLPFMKISYNFARFLHYFAIPGVFSALFLLKKLPVKRTWDIIVDRCTFLPLGYRFLPILESLSIIALVYLFDANLDIIDNVRIGHGVWVPVMETRYLLSRIPGQHNVVTTYSVGSYMMWKAFPRFKVYIDTRAAETFMDYIYFISQRYWKMKEKPEQLLERADIAVIAFRHWGLLKYFLDRPDWKAIYFGPTAVVFVKKERFPNARFYPPDWNKFKEHFFKPFYPENLVKFLISIDRLDLIEQFLKVAEQRVPFWYKFTKDNWDFILEAEKQEDDMKVLEKYLSGLIRIEKMPASMQQVILCAARKRIKKLFDSKNYSKVIDWEYFVFRFARHRESSLYNRGLALYKMDEKQKAMVYFSAFLNVIDELKIKQDDKPRVEEYVNVAKELLANHEVDWNKVKLMGI